ncbi:alpha/beta hydrolase fold-1 domain-containing protein [Heterostelium album PN500]|uniref:Alpha/beta hydrolase fold-1 domain-containing protein n=1 Tax=Heterostelium pallidum (strain ATCC 26659 / Pp 5 / PN500) TaxID=670386 RepID=D3BEV1_HETP5|nr:alpha/beta hydrolase fold-1 domain-containing protein [Heterostelium album PN500]EFA80432.1 alpha/beta hydrolase fold-1 domain-containing protein [Heterostelium album PN500]|eukprot:XP_020432552.1 alpha/beta hydrolase fold-1 domain-containing protein [Heterostelium album PN500]
MISVKYLNSYKTMSEENIQILEQCPSMFRPFYNVKNNIILNNGHSSLLPTVPNDATYDRPFSLSNTYTTMIDYIKYKRKSLLKTREYLVNKMDGGTMALDWYDFGVGGDDKTPIVIFNHSFLGGSDDDSYINYFCRYAHETKGFRSVVFINRGCSGIPITANTTGLGCRTDDFEIAVDYIKQKYPNTILFNIGSYLGGTIGLNYLYKYKEESPITAHVCISNPVDLGESYDSYTKTFKNRMIDYRVLHRQLVKYYSKFDSRLKMVGTTLDDIKRAKSLREIDQLTTVKMFGYRNVDDYYDDANRGIENIENLGRPILMLSNDHDPRSIYEKLPLQKIKTNERVILALTKQTQEQFGLTTSISSSSSSSSWNNWCHRAALEYLSTFVKKIK